MPAPARFSLRPADSGDQPALQYLVDMHHCLHQHLDWRVPLDWLGFQPFLILEQEGRVAAALACPPDPPGIAWVRLFVLDERLKLPQTWRLLFEKIYASFPPQAPPVIASLALNSTFAKLLKNEGFSNHDQIGVLRRSLSDLPETKARDGLSIQPMLPQHLPEVCRIDNVSFSPLWRNSLETILRSYMRSDYSTLLMQNERIIGYQISSSSPGSAHLARLAVEPAAQGEGLGTLLVQDLLRHSFEQGFDSVTVNTQEKNRASLAVYRKAGFELTGEKFPVYLFSGFV